MNIGITKLPTERILSKGFVAMFVIFNCREKYGKTFDKVEVLKGEFNSDECV
jgi:hypothetical protein